MPASVLLSALVPGTLYSVLWTARGLSLSATATYVGPGPNTDEYMFDAADLRVTIHGADIGTVVVSHGSAGKIT
jgi:hypothetical protein